MSEIPPLEIGTDVQGNQIYANVNKLVPFNVFVKNMGSIQLPRIYITLNSPPEIKIVTKRKSIAFVPRGRVRKTLFKMKSRVNGSYDLEAVITRNDNIIGRVPIKFNVGQAPASQPSPQIPIQQQPQPVSTPQPTIQAAKIDKCPFCGEQIEGFAKFCPGCGIDLTEKGKSVKKDTNICPNCGSQQPPQANFCGECGSDIN